MARQGPLLTSSRAAAVAWLVSSPTMVALAARSDLRPAQPGTTYVVLDLAVGVAYLFAGPAYRGDSLTRILLTAVGATWLVASVAPSWDGVHQGILLLALASAAGLQAGRAVGVVILEAALVGAGGLGEQVVGLGFLLLAGLLVGTRRPLPRRARPPLVAAILVALCLGGRWWLSATFPAWTDPRTALYVYEGFLLAIAVVLTVASRSGSGPGTPLTGRLLHGTGSTGVEGLTAVLADALNDPTLEVIRPGPGGLPDPPAGARWLTVDDRGHRVAVVAYRSAPLDDPGTAASVAEAVRLTLANDALRDKQERQLDDLEAARSRILAAADRQRARAAAALREDVVTLDRVGRDVAALTSASSADGAGAAEALVVVTAALAAASREILGLVAGVPPADLGGGRLRIELEALAQRAPLRVRVEAAGDVAADPATETAAYYVCAEALTNSLKHSDATAVVIELRRVDDGLAVSVRDNGRGGADPSGRGLQGLVDRVAAAGGRLRVESPRGAGTVLVATLPVS